MIFAFSVYELDLDRRELRRAGTPLRIEPKVFDLLVYLLQHHDRFVSRQDLHDYLWPNQFVSEHALTYCVAEARKAVGDSGRTQGLIKTIHGRGYCFIAPLIERPGLEIPPAAPATAASASVQDSAPTTPKSVPAPVDVPPQIIPMPVSLPRWPAMEAERRQLTMLWCRGVATSRHPRRLDPEELHQIWQAVQERCDQVIARFEGHIAQHFGEGFVVYFGHPRAYEDAAHRAVYTGLSMLQEIQEVAQQLQKQQAVDFALHIGIHTGPVVIGTLGQNTPYSPPALGETPRLASHLAQRAPAQSVLISAATLRLVEGAFICQGLGAQLFDVGAEPVVMYQVLRTNNTQQHVGPVRTAMGPFIGREDEVALLQERWQRSRAGQGQLVWLSGEAGIGKSRLVQVFHDTVWQDTGTYLLCRCSPYHQHSALYLVVEHMQRWLQWQPGDTQTVKLRKLETILKAYGFVLEDTVPLFADLLGLSGVSHYPALALAPPQQRQYTLATLLAWLLKKTEKQPLCLVVEDVHWIDPSTLELLHLLVDQVPMARILVLLTSRPEFVPPWSGRSHVTHITLNRLTDPQAIQLIQRVTVDTPLSQDVVQQLVARTNGVPLFIEEMTKMLLESGLEMKPQRSPALPKMPLTIPTTLHDSLMARLDHQSTGKLVAQVGSTLGREFSYGMLQAIAPLEEPILRQGLAQLVNAEILYQRGLPPQAQYLFKHALLQEAAYQSLLRQTRRHYHQHIAQVLEEHFPETRAAQPELLAHHYTEAGLNALAVAYWQQAGQHAQTRSAHVEALAHLRRGLTAAAALPETTIRLRHELTIYLSLGVSLMATQGYASPEVEDAYLQARDRCQQAGEHTQLFTVLRGLWLVYLVRGAIPTAIEQGTQLLHLAQQQTDPTLLLEAHRALGASLFFAGDLQQASNHLAQGLALYTTQQHNALTLRHGQDPAMACMVYTAWILWLRGSPDQALGPIQQALDLAQQCMHPFCLAFAHTFAVFLHWNRRDLPAVAAHVDASLALTQQQGFPLLQALGMIFQGGVRATQTGGEAGLEQIRQGIAAYRATGAELNLPYILGLLVEVSRYTQPTAESLTVLTDALALMEKSGERLHEAELYRLQGELRLQLGQQESAAEACLQHALTVARRQQAKSFELRAALCLSRLWHRQGKSSQAQHLLTEITRWFEEGLDVGDLQEARAFLKTFT